MLVGASGISLIRIAHRQQNSQASKHQQQAKKITNDQP